MGIFHGRCHAGQRLAKIYAEASAENETENSSGIRNCFFSNRSGTSRFTVVSVPSVFAVPANAGGGAVLLAASGFGRGNASGRRLVCMGIVSCEKIRACRKGVDIDSDDLQLILVTTAEYDKISALAEQAGHRIAPAETL